jgi:hypothetical protein
LDYFQVSQSAKKERKTTFLLCSKFKQEEGLEEEGQVQERDSVKKKNQISSETNKTLHCKKPNSLKLFSLFLTCEMILRGCINQIALAPFSLTNGNFTNGWRISHNKRGTMYADIVQFSQPEKTA